MRKTCKVRRGQTVTVGNVAIDVLPGDPTG